MKKIIDERGRLFGLVSVIDVIVLIVVIVLAVAVFTKFNVHDNPLTATNTVNVTYTIMINAIRHSTATLFRPGDNLYTNTGQFIGTITDVFIEDSIFPEPLVDGTFVMAKVHERYDATLTVEVQSSLRNGRYYADRVFELNANSEQRIQTKYVSTSGIIMSISVG